MTDAENNQPENNETGALDIPIGSIIPEGHACAGWVYMGISPSKEGERGFGKAFCVAAKDYGMVHANDAAAIAAGENSLIPMPAERKQILDNKNTGALAGTFNTMNDRTKNWYVGMPDEDYPGVPTIESAFQRSYSWETANGEVALRPIRYLTP